MMLGHTDITAITTTTTQTNCLLRDNELGEKSCIWGMFRQFYYEKVGNHLAESVVQ